MKNPVEKSQGGNSGLQSLGVPRSPTEVPPESLWSPTGVPLESLWPQRPTRDPLESRWSPFGVPRSPGVPESGVSPLLVGVHIDATFRDLQLCQQAQRSSEWASGWFWSKTDQIPWFSMILIHIWWNTYTKIRDLIETNVVFGISTKNWVYFYIF